MSWFWKKTLPPKPEDRVEYYWLGFSCRQGHCQSVQPSDSPTRFILWEEQICGVCGEKSLPSVIQQIQGSHLYEGVFSDVWVTNSFIDRTYKFVRFLDEDTVRLEEETVATLRKYAARRYQESDENADLSYQKGLNDGTIMTAKYVLGELKEEKNA